MSHITRNQNIMRNNNSRINQRNTADTPLPIPIHRQNTYHRVNSHINETNMADNRDNRDNIAYTDIDEYGVILPLNNPVRDLLLKNIDGSDFFVSAYEVLKIREISGIINMTENEMIFWVDNLRNFNNEYDFIRYIRSQQNSTSPINNAIINNLGEGKKFGKSKKFYERKL